MPVVTLYPFRCDLKTIGQPVVDQPVSEALNTILLAEFDRRAPVVHFSVTASDPNPLMSSHSGGVDMRLTGRRGIELQGLVCRSACPNELHAFAFLPPHHLLAPISERMFFQQWKSKQIVQRADIGRSDTVFIHHLTPVSRVLVSQADKALHTFKAQRVELFTRPPLALVELA